MSEAVLDEAPHDFVLTRLDSLMKPSETFGVVVRGIGLCLVLCGLYWLLSGVKETVYFILWHVRAIEEQDTYAITYFVDAVPTVLVGLLLLRQAEFIVRFAYPGAPPPRDNAP